MNLKNWNIEELTGYKPISTFYTDFSIADMFGIKAIKDTLNRCKKEWSDDYKYFTELIMVMSWKSFEHEDNPEYCKFYSEMYYKLDNEFFKKYEKNMEAINYYIKTTD